MLPKSKASPHNSPRREVLLGRKILLSAITAILFFGTIEILLWLARFQVNQSVERMEFTLPIDDNNSSVPQSFLVRDEILFWRPSAGVMEHNSHGSYGPEFNIEKKPGGFRIVCLGDSCTHFGPDSYPKCWIGRPIS